MNKSVKRIAPLFAILALAAAVLLMACAPAAVPPAATQAPAAATQAPAPTQAPAATEPPAATAAPAATEAPAATTAAEPTQGAAAPVEDRATTLILDTEGGQVADSKNFNPYSGGRGGSNGIVNALIEPMFTTNLVTGEFEPWLGESMTANDDFTVWTLKLRDGIEWSDGTPLTADDVVFTVEMIQKFPDLATPHKFKDVGVKKVDDLTVEFTLPESDPRFQLTVWAGQLQSQEVRIVPKHIWESVADPVTFTNYDPEKGLPVFSGAWTLDRVVSDTEFQYKLNENWWGAKSGWRELPAVKTIVWTLLGDENTRAAALENGDIDQMAISSPSTFLTLIAKNPDITAWSAEPPYGNPDVCGRSLEFNHTVAPWDDPEMRWAVAQIIDRDKLIDIAYNGFTTPGYNFLPPFEGLDKFRDLLESEGIYEKYPIQKIDVDAAKAVFEAKGYTLNGDGIYEKDGKTLGGTIVNFDDTIINSMNGALIEQLRAAGIDAKQDIQPIPTFVENLLNNKLEMYIFFGSCGSTVDPWKSMDSYSVRHIPEGDAPISGFYSNSWRWNTETAKKYSEIVEQVGKLVPGDPKIEELWVEAMDLWYSELPGVPLVNQYLIWPVNPAVWTNWPTEENGYIQPDMAGTNTLIILHNLKPAQ